MPEHPIRHGSVNVCVQLDAADWNRINKAARRDMLKSQHKIREACIDYILLHSAENNAINSERVEKRLESIVKHAAALGALLKEADSTSPAGQALFQLGRAREGSRYSYSPTFSGWEYVTELAQKGQKALDELRTKSLSGRKGPRHRRSLESFILELRRIYQKAGGKASAGTLRSKGLAVRRGSPFVDLVWSIHGALSRCEQNEIPRKSLTAMGESVYRALANAPGEN